MRYVELRRFVLRFILIASAVVIPTGCTKKVSAKPGSVGCLALSGSSWSPQVSGSGASNHDSAVELLTQTLTSSGTLTAMDQAYAGAQILTVTGITMDQDLGTQGSISLV